MPQNGPYEPSSLMGDLLSYQRQLNEWAMTATPEQRAALALNSLRYMEGQAYLFEDDQRMDVIGEPCTADEAAHMMLGTSPPDEKAAPGSNRPPDPPQPPAPSGTDDGGIPPDVLAPAVEGPIIRPKSKPRIVRDDG